MRRRRDQQEGSGRRFSSGLYLPGPQSCQGRVPRSDGVKLPPDRREAALSGG